MKRTILKVLTIALIGINISISPALAHSKKSHHISYSKVTKERMRKLDQLKVPKSYWDFGSDLSLREMGNIIAVWIVDYWQDNGNLPATIIGNPPKWLHINVNGNCLSDSETCDRWGN